MSRKELDGMGCGCCRDEGLGRKTEVARGGWAEDARRRPATSLVSVLIALVGSWGRVGAFDTKVARYMHSEGEPARRLGQRPVRGLRTKIREVWRVLLAVRVPAQRCL